MNGLAISGLVALTLFFFSAWRGRYKSQRKLFLIGLTATILASCSSASSQSTVAKTEKVPTSTTSTTSTQEPAKGSTFTAKVTRVTDGDTFHIMLNGKDETVRMLLIDTPETHKPNTPVQPFGPEAEAFTRKMLEGKTVEIERDAGGDARDKYGRLLYYVYVDGKSVQEELLSQGLARVAYLYPPNIKYVDKYKEIQAQAQKKAIGIWSIENYARQDGYHPEAAPEESKSSGSQSTAPKQQEKSGKPLIKGNINSKGEKIYHVPGGAFYDKTVAEEWFYTEEEAKAAGYRPSQK